MHWQEYLRGDPIPWLLEEGDPDVAFLTMRDLLDIPANDPELLALKKKAYSIGPIPYLLNQMDPQGFWKKPGPGYSPKYQSTVWTLILLAQLGACADMDDRIRKACKYFLDHAVNDQGQVSYNGAPSGTIDCLQGNMLAAFQDLGFRDARIDLAFEWMARSVTGEGVASNTDREAPLRYYRYKCGPLFTCGANNKLPCAWGAAKVMLAFVKLPPQKHTPLIDQAIQAGIDFLFSVNPAGAEWPIRTGSKPSSDWWKFGFPVFYVSDLLQVVESLSGFGFGKDPRLQDAIAIIRNKQDLNGRWVLEYDYSGKIWQNFGVKKQANKWVTLRALRALKSIGD